MKLLELHLLAYGPFTDTRLDFSEGREGLHVVFGPNEAGKSSALRGLRALLFGVPERTADNFVHDNADLRVGGRFRSSNGEELACYRRKGRRRTLLDANGAELDEQSVARLLGGVDQRLFERLFGVDHEALVSGGAALLAERGREAEALFGSGLGGAGVHTVLKELDKEALELFAPRASKPPINERLSRLRDVHAQLKDVSLSARRWNEARNAVETSRRGLLEIENEIADATARQSTLERIRRTLPILAKRAAFLEQLEQLGEVPSLPEDFARVLEQTLARRRSGMDARTKVSAWLRTIRTEASTLNPSDELLMGAERIELLRERLGAFRQASAERPRLAADKLAVEQDAIKRLCAIRPGLGLADMKTLRALLAKRRRAAELGARKDSLEAKLESARKSLSESEAKHTLKRCALSDLPAAQPVDLLADAVAAARRLGDIDRAIHELEADAVRRTDSDRRGLASLRLWRGSVADLIAAPLPSGETVESFQERFRDLGERTQRADQMFTEREAERRDTEKLLRSIELGGAVPSERDLERARDRRNLGWRLLRRQWLEGDDVTAKARFFGKGSSLPDAYEQSVVDADEIADRLRREAHRVQSRAEAQATAEHIEACLGRLHADRDRLAAERNSLLDSWDREWSECGISPLTPREMKSWLANACTLRDEAILSQQIMAKLQELRRTRQEHATVLRSALEASGESAVGLAECDALDSILAAADRRWQLLAQAERRREVIEGEVSELEETIRRQRGDVEQAEQALASWRSDWEALTESFGLGVGASPTEAADFLDAIDQAARKVDESVELANRISAIDAEAKQFEEDAADLLGRLAPDLLNQSVKDSVIELSKRLGDHQRIESRLETLRGQEGNAQKELVEAESEIAAADETLRDLCSQARCGVPDQLPAIENRHNEHRELMKRLREVEIELIEGGDGLAIDALQTEAMSVDRDAVVSQILALGERIKSELDPERGARIAAKLEAERVLADMSGGDEASVLAELAQETYSELRSLSERYVRARLAARILRDEIERFRREHRDPIVLRTSHYFKTLTCGSFDRVETDFDESDEPILVGVRQGGHKVRVEGMSTGTRDQLYLSLRLATLDHYLDATEPVPFIVDDVLIQFDDERTVATLRALHDFSRKTQVVLFTHHRRVADTARSLDQDGKQIFVHDLGCQ